MHYKTQLEHLHDIRKMCVTLLKDPDKVISKHIGEKHYISRKSIKDIAKRDCNAKLPISYGIEDDAIDNSNPTVRLLHKLLETIDENILECQFHDQFSSNEKYTMVKRLNSVYVISATNLAAFMVVPNSLAKPCNCFVVKPVKESIGMSVRFKFDDTLHKRGFLNTPDKWIPRPRPDMGSNMYSLPLGPFLGFPLYPHTEVNPHGCVASFNEAKEKEVAKKVVKPKN
jgi:hypothetical protein